MEITSKDEGPIGREQRRATSERIGYNIPGATVIRINPREPEIRPPHISMPWGALEGLQKLDSLLTE